ncbi:hypothetical protein RHS01_10178 [Rhizoctonia solani]|uniref:F-box domain-containing protein n=1 Tax=Rhizoctonia solani TaxID=456999 RepID=A0A8H7M0D5_9AGAM|nr:hypothetical protein RHS01_10178 [Rhizoctonia solani]
MSLAILCLPDEILEEIFKIFVYNRYEENQFSTVRPMKSHVELIYRRIHSLLAVCTTWRNVAISCKALWYIIPVVDPDVGKPRILSTGLSLQRAGNKNLNLTILNPSDYRQRLKSLMPRFSQFYSIIISCNSHSLYRMEELFCMLAQDGSSKSLSKFSLKLQRGDHHITAVPRSSPLYPSLVQIFRSLTSLHLSYVRAIWKNVSFSALLTELWVEDSFVTDAYIRKFFLVLNTAPELREFTVVGMVNHTITSVPVVVSLPKLKSLCLEGISLNLLKLFFNTLSPGSCQLTVNLVYILFGLPWDTFSEYEANLLLFPQRPIHKLIVVKDEDWPSKEELADLLQSALALKILVLSGVTITHDLLQVFTPPSLPTSSQNAATGFPKLETLELHATSFHPKLKHFRDGFDNLLAHHPLQRMVLAGTTWLLPTLESLPLEKDDEIVDWLKDRIPQFYFSTEPGDMARHYGVWQLWDV